MEDSRTARFEAREEITTQKGLMSKYGNAVGVQRELDSKDKRLLDLERERDRWKDQYMLQQARLRETHDLLTANTGAALIARYSEDIRRSAVDEAKLGLMTIERQTKYTHREFVNRHLSPLPQPLGAFPSFFDIVKSAFENAQPALSGASSSDPLQQGDKLRRAQRNLYKGIAATIDAACVVAKPAYQSVVAYTTIFNVLAVTRSPLAADMVDNGMCGGVSSQTINRHLYDLVKEHAKWKHVSAKKDSITCCHDNNSVNYTPTSSRSGISQSMLSAAMVWTMREISSSGPGVSTLYRASSSIPRSAPRRPHGSRRALQTSA